MLQVRYSGLAHPHPAIEARSALATAQDVLQQVDRIFVQGLGDLDELGDRDIALQGFDALHEVVRLAELHGERPLREASPLPRVSQRSNYSPLSGRKPSQERPRFVKGRSYFRTTPAGTESVPRIRSCPRLAFPVPVERPAPVL